MMLLLMEWKRYLQRHLLDSEIIYVNRYFEEQGGAFERLVEERTLEVIVAKHKESFYQLGKRSRG